MKCTYCGEALPVIKYDGMVPYWYKDHETTISDMKQYVCPHCRNKTIPPGLVQRWLEQTALFRSAVDAQEPSDLDPRPESLKDKIMIEWLTLDPDRLADEVPVEDDGYIRWKTLANYAEKHGNKVFEAFAGYKGSHTSSRSGYAYPQDWLEFLDMLRKARGIAADPYWEPPRNGVVYHCLV